MKLLYQTHSPYARKVLVMAHELGLADRIEVIHHETSPTNRNDTVFAANPLGKVPILTLPDGAAIFDSAVICDYLDGLHDRPRLIPATGPARIHTLRLQALATGIADAGIALRWETERRPELLRYPALAAGQALKLRAAYDFIERDVSFDASLDLGQIALATALSWIEFRHLPSFRDGHPGLVRWYDAFVQRASMRQTELQGETVD
ncbi:MAG TPA: glutathione S-transferase N-terminal domain-containing protein [Dongiaceae bacterium]